MAVPGRPDSRLVMAGNGYPTGSTETRRLKPHVMTETSPLLSNTPTLHGMVVIAVLNRWGNSVLQIGLVYVKGFVCEHSA